MSDDAPSSTDSYFVPKYIDFKPTEPRHFTINKLCVEPFPDKSVKIETFGEGEFKVARATNTKTNLVGLKVLKNCNWYLPGGSVVRIEKDWIAWFRSSEYSAPWGKEVLTVDGQQFIMIPCDRVEFVQPTL